MKMKFGIVKMTHFVLFFILASAVHLSLEDSDDWSYSGKNGPDHWPGICVTGKKQSPINIISDDTVKTDVETLKFERYNYAYTGTLTNTGHTVRLDLTGVPIFLSGGGLPSTYVFEQLHFHWNAEHTIDGHRDALELHMVHYAKEYPSFEIAAQHDYGLSVVTVLFEIGEKDNRDLLPIIKATKTIAPWTEPHTIRVPGKIKPSLLLPKDCSGFYRYEGSLTTPACQETVTWFILNEKLKISKPQLRVFEGVMSQNGSLKFNYRPIQKLGSRNVYHRLSDISGASMVLQEATIYISTLAIIISSLLSVP